MANIATYLETALLNHVMRNTLYTRPSVVYCGLVDSTGSDSEMEAGTLTNEITSYTGNRPAITFGAPADVGGAQTIKNTSDLEFLVMPAITVKYAIVCYAATAGNILYWAPLAAQKTTNSGDTFKIATDDLVLDLA